jgi:coenzyme F420-0:L-glutamate ligase/coenzyme F420-1:gamma-L-glutamate ligase
MSEFIQQDRRQQRERVQAWTLPGIPEIVEGDNLAGLIARALEVARGEHPGDGLQDGDIVVVSSKIVSKAEGRFVIAADREEAITAETVRVVARRGASGGGPATRIVENHLGIVAAAAGVDASNTLPGTVLLLPIDPDRSARELATSLRERFGKAVGVVITDTLGRPWRVGQTDAAIGAAGVLVIEDLRGELDAQGRVLGVTEPAVADEIAAMADLVKRKNAGTPVAVVRGLGRLVTALDGPGARTLNRPAALDMFRLGTDEAMAEGYRRAQAGEPLAGQDGRAPLTPL